MKASNTILKAMPWIIIIGILFLFVPELTQMFGVKFPLLGDLEYKDRLTSFLTFVIMIFTIVQVSLDDRRNRIEDMRNELEKAYGPLYGLLNSPEVENRQIFTGETAKIAGLDLSKEEKNQLDSIFIAHSYMFPKYLFELWLKRIRYLKSFRPPPHDKEYFAIPTEFKKKIDEEYSRKKKEYNEVIGRKKEEEYMHTDVDRSRGLDSIFMGVLLVAGYFFADKGIDLLNEFASNHLFIYLYFSLPLLYGTILWSFTLKSNNIPFRLYSFFFVFYCAFSAFGSTISIAWHINTRVFLALSEITSMILSLLFAVFFIRPYIPTNLVEAIRRSSISQKWIVLFILTLSTVLVLRAQILTLAGVI